MNLIGQFSGFLVVGTLTTALDFFVYNLLTRRPAAWHRVPASLVSCTVAMSFSFSANWHFVFHPVGSEWLGPAAKFLVVTATSSYLLQSLVIHGLSHWWLGPVHAAQRFAGCLWWLRERSADLVARNTVKAAAVGVGLLWNFAWYRAWVYA